MKKFIRISIWAFFLTLFSACTLMLDEPENVGEEVPEQNGDGWESPRTETEDMGSVTYQFTKTTVYLDESYRQYIIKADCDTASKHIDIYMKKSTPKDLIPQRGTTLASNLYDIFDVWVVHKVDFLENVDANTIKISCSSVETDEVFESLKFSSSFYLAPDSTESRNGEARLIAVPVNGSRGTKKWTLISESFMYSNNYSSTIVDKLSTAEFSFLNNVSINKMPFSRIFGDFTAVVGAKTEKTVRIDTDYDQDKGIMDFHGYVITEDWAYGGFKDVKGGFVIPLVGTSGNLDVNTFTNVVVPLNKDAGYLVSFPTESLVKIPVGLVLVELTPDFNAALSLYAQASADKSDPPQLTYYKREVSEFGMHYEKDKPDKTYWYPHEGATSIIKPASEFKATGGFDRLTFGVKVDLGMHFIVTIGKVVNISLGGSLSPTFEIRMPFTSSLYGFGAVKIDDKYIINTDNYKNSLFVELNFDISGSLGFKKWSTELFKFTFKGYMSPKKEDPLYPKVNQLIIDHDSENTTYNEAAYIATFIFDDYTSMFGTKETPRLAIVTSDYRLVKIVDYDDYPSSVTAHFTVPIEFDDKGLVSKTSYYAIPIAKVPFISDYTTTQDVGFTLGGEWIKFSDCSQMDTRNVPPVEVEDDYNFSDEPTYAYCEAYMFSFNRHRNPFDNKNYFIKVNIYDEELSEVLAEEIVKLNHWDFTDDNTGKFIGWFMGIRDSYNVVVSVYYKDTDGTDCFLGKKKIHIVKGFVDSKKEFDPRQPEHWALKGYKVLGD